MKVVGGTRQMLEEKRRASLTRVSKSIEMRKRIKEWETKERRNEVRTGETARGVDQRNYRNERRASAMERERRLNISEPNPPIGRGSTSRVGIDFQSRGGGPPAVDARHRSTLLNSCLLRHARVHPFLYRWTERTYTHSSLSTLRCYTPFRFDAAEPSTVREGSLERVKLRLRTGDRTILLTRVRCAHLGVTHSFVPSVRCDRSKGERYRRKKSGGAVCDEERNRECTAPANCRQGDGDTGKIELK